MVEGFRHSAAYIEVLEFSQKSTLQWNQLRWCGVCGRLSPQRRSFIPPRCLVWLTSALFSSGPVSQSQVGGSFPPWGCLLGGGRGVWDIGVDSEVWIGRLLRCKVWGCRKQSAWSWELNLRQKIYIYISSVSYSTRWLFSWHTRPPRCCFSGDYLQLLLVGTLILPKS